MIIILSSDSVCGGTTLPPILITYFATFWRSAALPLRRIQTIAIGRGSFRVSQPSRIANQQERRMGRTQKFGHHRA